MAVRQGDKYLCGYCGKPYTDATKADICRDSHELVYVAFSVADLNSLLHFIHSKNDDFLTESLMNTLNVYLRGN